MLDMYASGTSGDPPGPRISATPSPRPAVSITFVAVVDECSIEAPATPPAINVAIPMLLSAFVGVMCITGLLFRLGSSVASGFSEDTSRSVQELGVKDKTHSATRQVRVGVRP